MEVISSREFRQHQRKYFDKIDEGKEIIVKRGKNKSYRIAAVTEEDMVVTKKEFLQKLDNAKSDVSTTLKTKEDIDQFFDSI